MMSQQPVQVVIVKLVISQQQVESSLLTLLTLVSETPTGHRARWDADTLERAGLTSDLVERLDEVADALKQYANAS